MKRIGQVIYSSMLTAVLFTGGCATERPDVSTTGRHFTEPQVVTQDQARQLTGQFTRQAADLRSLASRAEWEAQWYAGQFGTDDQEAIRRRAQAQNLWAAAEEADELARGYRRQVPHGQIQ